MNSRRRTDALTERVKTTGSQKSSWEVGHQSDAVASLGDDSFLGYTLEVMEQHHSKTCGHGKKNCRNAVIRS